MHGRVRGVRGIGTACGSRPRGQELVGKQEVAARPCACEHAAASGRGEEDDGGLQWWAGPAAGWAGQLAGPHSGGAQVSSSCYIFFCFLISDICFDLKNILNHLFNLCQFLQELYILFQSSFINGIIFGHILIYIINIFPMQILMH